MKRSFSKRCGVMTENRSKRINFILNAPNASEVMLGGTFNNWDYNSTPLIRGKDKIWKTSLTLKPGRYEYKFFVDGNWTGDPNNDNSVRNIFGTDNSVIEI